MISCEPIGTTYRHPAMLDVDMRVLRKYYIKEKDMWELKVMWVTRNKTLPSGKIRHGGMLATERIRITNEKFREFKRV